MKLFDVYMNCMGLSLHKGRMRAYTRKSALHAAKKLYGKTAIVVEYMP